MTVYRSPLADRIDRFVMHKRSLGYAYQGSPLRLARRLDRLAATSGQSVIDEALVRRFVADGSRDSRDHRLSLVRQLARFLVVEEPRTFVPPLGFLGVRARRPIIRVLSRAEAWRFYQACDELPDWIFSPNRTLVHGTALRTLLLTGLRCGEIVRLRIRDVDLDAGVLTVRNTKFGKSRFVPVAAAVAKSLRAYHEALTARVPHRKPDDPFFPGRDGRKPCLADSLYRNFRRTIEIAGIAHGGRGTGPRLHDLRHTFAVLRLLRWYEQGADLSTKLPLLATYLGHVGLGSTQVYLHMTLDIAGEVVSRFGARFGDLIREEG